MALSKRTKREATQMFRLCQVKGLLDEALARKIVEQIIADKPRGYLAALIEFYRLVRLDRERHTARIESPAKLPGELQSTLQAGLGRAYGAGLTTLFADNPALIGGIRIKVGSDVYDGSVKARLAALEEIF